MTRSNSARVATTLALTLALGLACGSCATPRAEADAKPGANMSVAFREHAAFTVVGLSRYIEKNEPESFGKLWKDFYESGGKDRISNRASDDLFAVYDRYEGDHTKPFMVTIGCAVKDASSIGPGLAARPVPAGRYAFFEEKGPPPASVATAWKRVWSAPIQRAFAVDFEHYAGPQSVEVFISVR